MYRGSGDEKQRILKEIPADEDSRHAHNPRDAVEGQFTYAYVLCSYILASTVALVRLHDRSAVLSLPQRSRAVSIGQWPSTKSSIVAITVALFMAGLITEMDAIMNPRYKAPPSPMKISAGWKFQARSPDSFLPGP